MSRYRVPCDGAPVADSSRSAPMRGGCRMSPRRRLRGIVGARSDRKRFVMAGSGAKQTGILGRLRNKRDSCRQRRAEKAHAKFEAKRGWERSGEAGRPPPTLLGPGGGVSPAGTAPLGVHVLRRLPLPRPEPSRRRNSGFACLRNSAISRRECSFRERSRPLTPRVLLLRDDWSTLRADGDPGFLAGDLDEDRRRGSRQLPRHRSRRHSASELCTGTIGARRAWTVSMISVLSMPWR